MDREPRAGAVGQRKQWPVIAIAGLFIATVAAGGPSREQHTSDERDIPSARGQRAGSGGEPDHGADGGTLLERPTFSPRVAGGGDVTVRPVSFVREVPSLAFSAYQRAAADVAETQPGCHLPVSLLAAIGKVESGHARGGQMDAVGTTVHPILGPTLDGSPGLAAIADTDRGVVDGDARWDRAVGPMQFIPRTWRRWATDGNDDGDANPHNMFDAAGAAGRYLCANGRDLATEDGLRSAILSYNHSTSYLRIVRTWMMAYENGSVVPADRTPPAGRQGDGAAATPADNPDGTPARTPSTGGGRPPAADPAPPRPGEPEQPAPERPSTPERPTAPAPAPAAQDPITGTLTGLGCVVDGVVDTAEGLLGGIGGLLTGTAGPAPAPDGTCPATAPNCDNSGIRDGCA